MISTDGNDIKAIKITNAAIEIRKLVINSVGTANKVNS